MHRREKSLNYDTRTLRHGSESTRTAFPLQVRLRQSIVMTQKKVSPYKYTQLKWVTCSHHFENVTRVLQNIKH